MTENDISSIVLDASIRVHRKLGPGLLESAYQACLAYELQYQGLNVESEKSLPLIYRDVRIDVAYRADIMVENKVLIEVKSVKRLDEIHLAQVLSYLKLTDLKLGLLINFNELLLKRGFKRIVNNL